MVTFEDITDMFLHAAQETGLSVHPEFWMNTQTLEREFACAMHPGPCEEADRRATCTLSFAWGPLDTALSLDGAEGICEFFHEPDEDCPHLHTENVPPLVLDLAYHLPLDNVAIDDRNLRQLARMLKLRASEHSSRAGETRPSVALALDEDSLRPEALSLHQRVELPLWDPEGVHGYRSNASDRRSGRPSHGRGRLHNDQDEPHPEEWLPHLMTEVAEDISRVVVALEETRTLGQGGAYGSGLQN